jgi:hypothetical protein
MKQEPGSIQIFLDLSVRMRALEVSEIEMA